MTLRSVTPPWDNPDPALYRWIVYIEDGLTSYVGLGETFRDAYQQAIETAIAVSEDPPQGRLPL